MARRRRTSAGRSAGSATPLPDDAARHRYRWLGRWRLAAEPESEAASISDKVSAEMTRLNAKLDLSPVDRLGALERFLESHGWLEKASYFADNWVPARRHPDDPRGTPLTRTAPGRRNRRVGTRGA